MGGGGTNGYPYILTSEIGYRHEVFAVGGTGFVQGEPSLSFETRVDAIIALQPDVVLVEGGHNDTAFPVTKVDKAVDQVLTQLRVGLPEAKIIVQGVPWPGTYSTWVTAIDATLRAEAKKHNMPFIDASKWFVGDNLRLIGTDGTHPTDGGHKLMARKLQAAFGRLDLPAGRPEAA